MSLINCTIKYSPMGITLTGSLSSVLIKNNYFKVNGGKSAVTISGTAENVVISSSSFIDDYNRGSSRGITISGHQRAIIVTNSNVSGFKTGIMLLFNGAAQLCSISNCTVVRNKEWGIYIHRPSLYYHPSWITSITTESMELFKLNVLHNEIASNYQGIYIVLLLESGRSDSMMASWTLSQNSFQNNSGKVVYITQRVSHHVLLSSSSVNLLSRNIFEKNIASSDSILVIDAPGSMGAIAVENNVFRGNTARSIVSLIPGHEFRPDLQVGTIEFRKNVLSKNTLFPSWRSPYVAVKVTGSTFFFAYHNVFDNLGFDVEVGFFSLRYMLTRQSFMSHLINITFNYWGTSDSAQIESKILYSQGFSYLPTVLYSPFLLSPNSLQVGTKNRKMLKFDSVFHRDGTVGGSLNTAITLTASRSPYLVTETLRVLAGGILTIESGVTLQFKFGIGLDVRDQGCLLTKGTLDKPIYLTAEPRVVGNRRLLSLWAGLRFFNSHSSSSLSFTRIVLAGRLEYLTVPAIQCWNRVPQFYEVTIENSYSTALSVTVPVSGSRISGLRIDTAIGDGIHIRRPSGVNVTIDRVFIANVGGIGISVQQNSSGGDPTAFQSICSSPATGIVNVDSANPLFLGLHGNQHFSGMLCSVVLVAPAGKAILLSATTLQLYDDDRLFVRDGNSAYSLLLANYTGQSYADGTAVLSSSNEIFIELSTGSKSHAPGFMLRIAALSSVSRTPFIDIRNVFIKNAYHGVSVSNVSDDLEVSNVTIIQTQYHGVFVSSHTGASSVVGSRVVESSRGDAIYLNDVRGDVFLRENTLKNCGHGIRLSHVCDNETSNVIIEANVMSGNRLSGISLFLNYSDQRLPAKSNCRVFVALNYLSFNVIGCQIAGSSLKWLGGYETYLSGNNFTANKKSALSATGNFAATINAYNNTFTYHKTSEEGGTVFLDVASPALNISENKFNNNRGSFVLNLLSSVLAKSSVFVGNVLINNTIITPLGQHQRNGARDFRNAIIILSQLSDLEIRGNIFANFDSPYELAVNVLAQSSGEATVNASRNYWGDDVKSEVDIHRRIRGFESCSRLARVNVIPFLKSPSGPEVSPPRTDDGIVRQFSLVGGIVSNRFVIKQSKRPYIVVNDISVLPMGELVIKKGVELRFSANTGILIEGRLTAKGTSTKPIRMIKQDEEGSLRLVPQSSVFQGTVEIYHDGSWGALCASRGTVSRVFSRNQNYNVARVVCRVLFNQLSLYEYLWVDPFYGGDGWIQHVLCTGKELDLSACQNYEFVSARCAYGALKVSCYGVTPELAVKQKSFLYWSGIRFSATAAKSHASVMVNVEVIGAGIANVEPVAAIQAIGHNLTLLNVSVSKSYSTGVEMTNVPKTSMIGVKSSENGGSGIRLVNCLSCDVKDSQSERNLGHGLEFTSVSAPQRLWGMPIPFDQIVDICSLSEPYHISKPFYLRFIPRLHVQTSSLNCFINVVARKGFVPSFHLLTYAFGRKLQSLQIDGMTFMFDRSIGRAQHYIAENSTMTVGITSDDSKYLKRRQRDIGWDGYYFYDYDLLTEPPPLQHPTPSPLSTPSYVYDPESDYILAYVEEQPQGIFT